MSNVIKPFYFEPEHVEIDRNVEIIRGDEDEEKQVEEELNLISQSLTKPRHNIPRLSPIPGKKQIRSGLHLLSLIFISFIQSCCKEIILCGIYILANCVKPAFCNC